MQRIEPAAEPFPALLQEYFEKTGAPQLVLFTTIGRSERAWKKFSRGSLLANSPLSLRERELIIDRTTARTGCEYEWGVHVWLFAEKAGLSRDEIAGTLTYPLAPEKWSQREAALLTAVDALHDRSTLSDAEFRGLKQHYSDEQIIEIIQISAFYHQVAFLANGLALPLEAKAANFADYTP
ncbi:hypothetical protein GCM10019059_38280 [Camelimonas fluminis]|uniref:Carboxymuconolactone decarboxylase family protein n=1 Tax=Camelimonas fluminis TaxID=1576911 RepID=A0ABV7UN37_9HYPH|nr:MULTISPECIES: carboxymuconolactone decarboxylase family protein [Camelimonas]GHE75216.1 hypothetical protein GCM10019059_38280 [Camelimonas fluminis]